MSVAAMQNESIENMFTYHMPNQEQVEKLLKIRTAAKALARVIDEVVPNCADQAAAMRILRECTMTASCAVVLNGCGYVPTKAKETK